MANALTAFAYLVGSGILNKECKKSLRFGRGDLRMNPIRPVRGLQDDNRD